MDANGNITAQPNGTITLQKQVWPATIICEIVTVILMLLCNSFVLLVFSLKTELVTPFTIYIIALFSANIIYGLTRNILDVINVPYQTWWTGEVSCTLYNYSNWAFFTIPIHCHMLIAANRMWAISFPVSYRQRHTRKMAFFLCFSAFAYVHVIDGPPVVLDTLIYRLPIAENGCNINLVALQTAASVDIIMSCDVPIIFMLTSCFVLIYKHKRSGKIHSMKVIGSALVETPDSDGKNHISNNQQGGDRTNTSVAATNSDEAVPQRALAKIPAASSVNTSSGRSGKRGTSHGFIMVVGLTVSIFLCWTPSFIYYTFQVITAKDDQQVDLATSVLLGLQPVFDPIIVCLMFKDIREAVVRMFRESGC